MTEFNQGPFNEKAGNIVEALKEAISKKYLSHEITSVEVTHCPDTKLTFAVIRASFKGNDHPLLTDNRQIMITPRGKCKLISSKFKSKKKTEGFWNAVWTECSY